MRVWYIVFIVIFIFVFFIDELTENGITVRKNDSTSKSIDQGATALAKRIDSVISPRIPEFLFTSTFIKTFLIKQFKQLLIRGAFYVVKKIFLGLFFPFFG